MKQYYGIKAVHGDAILLFRVGDFYETFGEDAIKASKILGITLTRRANGAASYVELAGFPYHAVDTYLPKLVRAGERVAICEQLEDPKTTKKIVKRGVIELVTPGISLSDNILSCKENTFLAAVHFADKRTGVAFLDLSTGEFFAAEGDSPYVDKLLANLSPKEVIYQKGYESEFSEAFGTKHYTYRLDPWMFAENSARDKLLAQFGTTSLKGFGIEQMPAAITAAGAILYYLEFTEHRQTGHISSISRIDEDRYVWIDKFSIRNLELFTANGGQEGCSLFDVLDRTGSPMGARMLRRWISLPLKDPGQINRRLDVVSLLRDDASLRETLAEAVASTVVRSVIRPVAVALLRFLVFFVLFILLMIVVGLVARLVNGLFKAPVLKQVNGALGAVIGLIQGILFLFVAVTVVQLVTASASADAALSAKDVEDSILVGFVADHNPITSALESVMKSLPDTLVSK